MNQRLPRRLSSREYKGIPETYDETLLSSLRCHPHFALLSDDQRVLLSKMMSTTDTFSSSDFYVLVSGRLKTSTAVYVEGDTIVGPLQIVSHGSSNDEIRCYTLPISTYELLCKYILQTLGENLRKFFNHNVDFLSAVSSSTKKSLFYASVLHEFPQSHEFSVLPKRQSEGCIYLIFSGKCGVFVNGTWLVF